MSKTNFEVLGEIKLMSKFYLRLHNLFDIFKKYIFSGLVYRAVKCAKWLTFLAF